MTRLARLEDQHLLRTIAAFPPEISDDQTNRAFYLSLAIVRHFLGAAWADEHVQDTGGSGYLRLDWNDKDRAQRQAYRILDLAEILFNLQRIDGFDECIQRMKDGDIEGTYAELDLGRMLFLDGLDFRFVSTSGNKGDDFDLEIVLTDGLSVCADAKCKIETTDYSENTVLNSLSHARQQFPPDKPSIIFVKLPPRWVAEVVDIKGRLTEVALRFLRGTGRVVSIKFYVSYIHWENGFVTHIQAFHEINNQFNRFDPSRNWDMFSESNDAQKPNHRGEFTDVPTRWRRLMYYPDGMPK